MYVPYVHRKQKTNLHTKKQQHKSTHAHFFISLCISYLPIAVCCNCFKSSASPHYSISPGTVMFFSVVMNWTSVVVLVYCVSLRVQCRTDASIFGWLRCADCFWQFVKLYKISLSGDNIIMCAVVFQCTIVNWTSLDPRPFWPREEGSGE